jgi:hypothetical protein
MASCAFGTLIASYRGHPIADFVRGVPWPNLFGHVAFFPASMHMPTQAWAWHPAFRNRNKLGPDISH